jgi:hypothetical protein
VNAIDLEQRFPLASALVGVTGGALSWMLSHTAEITGVAGMIGAVCTALISLVGVFSFFLNRLRAVRAWFAMRRHNREQRRKHFRRIEPHDELP